MNTTTAAPLFTLYCPNCGHDDIAGCDMLPGLAGIVGWRVNPVTGKPEPEWEGSTEVIWDGQRPASPEAPYCCRRCCESFAADELHANRDAPHQTRPKDRTTPPVARVVIVMYDGMAQLLLANERVSAVVIDRNAFLDSVRQIVASDAATTGSAVASLAVEIRPEFVDSLFSGQS